MRGTGSPQPDPIGYGRQYVDDDDIEAVVEALRSDRLTQGPVVPRFEEAIRRWTGAAHAVSVCNGSAALHLIYLALGADEETRVLTSANTFLATATAAKLCGAEVEFVDIEARTGNLDVDVLEGRLQSGDPPDIVTAVHFAGLPCDMERLIELKRRYGFRLVEDAAHALGASYRVDGRLWRVGEHPEIDATILSFHAVKHITTGEGGAVLTSDAELARRLRRLREHGVDREGSWVRDARRSGEQESGILRGHVAPWFAPMVELGLNARLSEIHAALGISQFRKLPEFLEARNEIAKRYIAELPDFELLDPGDMHRRHAWHLFVVRTEEGTRDDLILFLRERGIQTQVHYYPVPLQPWFSRSSQAPHFPNAERHYERSVSLPIYPALSEEEQRRVIEALLDWRRRRAVA